MCFFSLFYYPRDAILALLLAMALCLSATSQRFIETTKRIGLVLGTGASFDLSYSVL